MPSRPRRPCRKQGCPCLVEGGGFCDTHLAEQRTRYDREQRNPERAKFYGSTAWHQTRRIKLASDPVCSDCHKDLATDVDHVQPLADRWDLRLSLDNLRSLCHSCHSRRTATEAKRLGVW